LRYVSGQSRATLARLPIAVTAVTAELEAPPVVPAGGNVKIVWTGPDNQNDFITIVPAGTEEGKYGNYTYTRKGSPLDVKVPEEPGVYELRYLNGQSRTTLTSLPITVN
jgi:Ca-activated chloride channel family protein